MSERSRSTFLLGCFGVAVLYLPDCARILAGEPAASVVHAAEPSTVLVPSDLVGREPDTVGEAVASARRAEDLEYVGGQ
ncbi:MAG: hypothetical protein GY711_12220 [bacterium]|nr:hypothetical protein [bacterium]